jgi:DNA-directed RNA polymerase specialized sigma24 family protein
MMRMLMRTGRIFRDPYGTEPGPDSKESELEVLVKEYEELDGLRHKAWIHVRLMDIDQAWDCLPPTEKEAILLLGFMGLRLDTAAAIMDVGRVTMWDRYNRGLRYLASYLNGGS